MDPNRYSSTSCNISHLPSVECRFKMATERIEVSESFQKTTIAEERILPV